MSLNQKNDSEDVVNAGCLTFSKNWKHFNCQFSHLFTVICMLVNISLKG